MLEGCVAVSLGEAGTVYVTGRTTQVEAVFAQISANHGRLDLLVNDVWGGYERMMENGVYRFADAFWEQPLSRWDSMFRVGVRARYVASAHGARTRRRGGVALPRTRPHRERDAAAEFLYLSNSESPEFVGRAVAALAREYGFSDIDGRTPRPLSLAEV